jgi:hypothetical protein
MHHQHPLSETPPNTLAGFVAPAVDGIAVEQSAEEDTPAGAVAAPRFCAVVIGACVGMTPTSPGNCKGCWGLVDAGALTPVDEETGPIDEGTPAPNDDTPEPPGNALRTLAADPGEDSVAVGRLSGSEGQGAAANPPTPVPVEQGGWIWTFKAGVVPGVVPGSVVAAVPGVAPGVAAEGPPGMS